MIYVKPKIKTVQISAPPLAANFAPPPISIVPVCKENSLIETSLEFAHTACTHLEKTTERAHL